MTMTLTPEQIREARIKLAEWMGWKRVPHDNGFGVLHYWTHPKTIVPDRADCPDPFTDANDDYAVLEAMRDKCGKTETKWLPDPEQSNLWFRFVNWLPRHTADYTIGDYARAALKEIDNDT